MVLRLKLAETAGKIPGCFLFLLFFISLFTKVQYKIYNLVLRDDIILDYFFLIKDKERMR
ncbi:MAG: hypothetical protein A4E56_02483 [Pelotomaculum sp. PtaU1.Bin065]|nr:MAG: hypothetical protein A4E56_02483 [Pelotomaculum sp. PtaU1.Bin065]